MTPGRPFFGAFNRQAVDKRTAVQSLNQRPGRAEPHDAPLTIANRETRPEILSGRCGSAGPAHSTMIVDEAFGGTPYIRIERRAAKGAEGSVRPKRGGATGCFAGSSPARLNQLQSADRDAQRHLPDPQTPTSR